MLDLVVRTAWTWDWRNVLGLCLTAVFAMLSAPGGQSGNWWYIPCFTVLLQFGIKQAIPLCSFAVSLGAVASVLYALAEEHPLEPGQPLIDYQTVVIISPAMMVGSAAGVLLNMIFPGWLLNLLMVCTLIWTTYKMAASYYRLHNAETQRKLLAEGISHELSALQQSEMDIGQDTTPELVDDCVITAQADDERGAQQQCHRLPAAAAAVAAPTAARQASGALVLCLGSLQDNLKHQLQKLVRLNREVHLVEAGSVNFPYMQHTVTSRLEQEMAPMLPYDGTIALSGAQEESAAPDAVCEVTAVTGVTGPLTGPRQRRLQQRLAQAAAVAVSHLSPSPAAAAASSSTAMHAGGQQAQHQGPAAATPAGPLTAGSSIAARTAAAIQRWWRMQPKQLQLLLLLLLVVYFTLSVLINTILTPCSAVYWGTYGVLIACMCGFTAAGVLLQAKSMSSKAPEQSALECDSAVTSGSSSSSSSDTRQQSDSNKSNRSSKQKLPAVASAPRVVWTWPMLRTLPAGMVLAGVASSMLGLGGGFIVNPLLLGLGVHPQIVAGTAKVMLLLSTATSSMVYLLRGQLMWQYGLAYGLLVMLATPVGIWAMDALIARSGRASSLVLLATVRLAAGFVLVVVFNLVPEVQQLASGNVEPFHPENVCIGASSA